MSQTFQADKEDELAAAAQKQKEPLKDWAGDAQNAATNGEFERDTTYIGDRIVASVTGDEPQPAEDGTGEVLHWPVQPNRYRLIAARACPWAHRSVIVRRLMGLENVISLGLPGPTHDKRSWRFDLDPDEVDPVLKIPRLQDAYFKRFPDYPRGITVPSLVEVSSGKIVTNDFTTLVRDFQTQWTKYHRSGAPNLLPPAEQWEEMEEINNVIFKKFNNGVYRAGFSASQDAYEEAYADVFEFLDWLEERLSHSRFILGEHITETDIRTYVTLVRFDAVYHGHFKTNRNKISEMPNVYGYLRELFQTPGFGDTTDFIEIKQHYYIVHREINPTQVVPTGPDLSGLAKPHGRDHLPGAPFANGATLPGALPHSERLKNPTQFQRELFGLS